jgi:hypothetical protein
MREARYISREFAESAAKYIRGPQVLTTVIVRHGDNDYGIMLFSKPYSGVDDTMIPQWIMDWHVNNQPERN